MARHCSEVIGIDYSHRFIEVARHLQQHGSIAYAYVEEGLLTTPATAVVPAEIDRRRVTFEQGDAQALASGPGRVRRGAAGEPGGSSPRTRADAWPRSPIWCGRAGN